MTGLIFLLIGMALGAVITFYLIKNKYSNTENLQVIFNDLSQKTLDMQSERFLQLAQTKLDAQTKLGEKDLENKKELIDKSLNHLKDDLNKVEQLIQNVEKQRSESFGSLTSQIKNATTQTESLQKITSELKSVLSNTKVRGQWGERMAEDILRMAGFIEGIQYKKQSIQEDSATKPDFTFNMPDGYILNMDVKFPLDRCLDYFSSDNETEKESFKKQFLKNAKARVNEILDRNYINKKTLDYVLLFIPNEQVYSFINEHDRAMLDFALSKKVIICAPNTLYAILSVVRQASENFQLEKTSSEILGLLADFKKQWEMYSKDFLKLEKQFESFGNTFAEVKSTRVRLLEKQLDKIEDMKLDKIEDMKNAQDIKQVESLS